MPDKQIINEKALQLGAKVKGADRNLISKNLKVSRKAVDQALSGKRRCVRGASVEVLRLAAKLAEINEQKTKLQ